MKKLMIAAGCLLILSACGNDKDASTEAEAMATPTETKAEPQKAYNPLANQQQLIKGAEEKKKALEEIY